MIFQKNLTKQRNLKEIFLLKEPDFQIITSKTINIIKQNKISFLNKNLCEKILKNYWKNIKR